MKCEISILIVKKTVQKSPKPSCKTFVLLTVSTKNDGAHIRLKTSAAVPVRAELMTWLAP